MGGRRFKSKMKINTVSKFSFYGEPNNGLIGCKPNLDLLETEPGI